MPSFFGVDLAWGEGRPGSPAKETGLAQLAPDGTVVDADWARGVDEVAAWLGQRMRPGDVLAIDAPLVVPNASGMRACERDVVRAYGRWKVAANPTNLGTGWLAGVTLRRRLEASGAVVVSGLDPAPGDRVAMFECYPYTTIVGAPELGYDRERPRYKRPNTALPSAERRPFRARECDGLIERMSRLAAAEPPLALAGHPLTAALVAEPSPFDDRAYKHREDLLDAVLCAWTAALWTRHGLARCQVLGTAAVAPATGGTDAPAPGTAPLEAVETDADGRPATIVAPARPEQRLR